jgi:predicted AAA+ superfamily ATPase
MIQRLFKPPHHSFFLFGPRGTGKSTLLKSTLKGDTVLTLDLLDPAQEDLYARSPQTLKEKWAALKKKPAWILIDEVQKVPRLLNVVHQMIEDHGVLFALTGSSPRKLKRGAANLLAGRAFVYSLFPLTSVEMANRFELNEALTWGTLPKILHLSSNEDKKEFLRAYALIYLKEEVVAEQLVRNLTPFRHFLEVAAQCNGQVLNYSKIAADVGADVKTVQSYFRILEDTLVGISLPAFHLSVRKRQRTHPKFYFFDTGVKRALEHTLDQTLYPKTFSYGFAFEHFVIIELHRLADYRRCDWSFSYFQTTDGGEIDLVVDRPGKPRLLIEIKSTDRIEERDVTPLNRFKKDIPQSEAYCLSMDPTPKKIGGTLCLPWNLALQNDSPFF